MPDWAVHRHVDVKQIKGMPAMFRIFLPRNGYKHVGHALVVWQDIVDPETNTFTDRQEALLFHIEVQERYRGMDVGRSLIQTLQGAFDTIITGPTNKDGRNFLFACGFRQHPQQDEYLFWEKDHDSKRKAAKN